MSALKRPIRQRRPEARGRHVVDRLRPERRVDHVAGDERVEEPAPELDATVRRQRHHQLLQVVADAPRLRAGEPLRQPLDGDARRVARHVPARPVRARERDPEEAASERPAGAHRPAKADRVAVRLEPRRQLVHLLGAADDPRVHVLDRAGRIRERVGARSDLGGGIRWRLAAEQVEAELEAALRVLLRRVVAGRGDARRRQPVDQRPELELAEALRDRPPVVSARARLLQAELDGQVDHDAADLARHERRLAMLGQPVAELALHLVEMLVDAVEGAELLEEAARGLLPHPRHPGDVVRGVALERLVVEHLVGAEAVALRDPRLVVDHRRRDAHPGRQQPHVVVDELEPVEVAGDDHRVDARGGGLLRERADDVIGLVARELADRDVHHRRDLADDRELRAQVVRHARPAALVVGIRVEPKLRLADVERHDRVVRLHVLHAAQDDLEEAEDGVHERAVGERQRRQREVAAVHQARPVDEHEERSSVGHRSLQSRPMPAPGPP